MRVSLLLALAISVIYRCASEVQSSCEAPSPELGPSLIQRKQAKLVKTDAVGTEPNATLDMGRNHVDLVGPLTWEGTMVRYNGIEGEEEEERTNESRTPPNPTINKTEALDSLTLEGIEGEEEEERTNESRKPPNPTINKTEALDSLTWEGIEAEEEVIAGFARLASRLPSIGFCRSHPCRLLVTEVSKSLRGLGKTAKLSQDGYAAVAQLKDDEEMKDFILRIIDRYDCQVKDMGGLMGLVPWFSGTVAEQSLSKLEDALLFAILADGEPWITYKNSEEVDGQSAQLNLQGYVQVACMRNDNEMKNFALRLAESMHIKVTDEGGFEGAMKYYSGSATFQSFETMKSEIVGAAEAKGAWAEFEYD